MSILKFLRELLSIGIISAVLACVALISAVIICIASPFVIVYALIAPRKVYRLYKDIRGC